MVFKLFRKRKEEFEFPEKGEIEVPPAPPAIPEEPAELPTFPSVEEPEVEVKEKEPEMVEEAPSSVEEMEKESISGVKESLEEREGLELTKPLFIEAKLYKGIIDDISVLKNTLKDSADELMKMGDLKDDREKNYSVWHKQIEDIQRKLIYVDNSLFGKSKG